MLFKCKNIEKKKKKLSFIQKTLSFDRITKCQRLFIDLLDEKNDSVYGIRMPACYLEKIDVVGVTRNRS
jgi:hypothetical protein